MISRRAMLTGGAAFLGLAPDALRRVLAAGVSPGADPAGLVDAFTGTGGHGHTYPGAVVPFGMVALSPDNGVSGWDWCSGYHWSSRVIAGFSHLHLSGTGIGDLCDISLMPGVRGDDGAAPGSWRAGFNHADESAEPGFYSVGLEGGIGVELTATPRVGLHRYRFPPAGDAAPALHLDLGFGINWDRPTETAIAAAGPAGIEGSRLSTGWAREQRVYFVLECSRPFAARALAAEGLELSERVEVRGSRSRAVLRFEPGGAPLVVKVGLSAVSIEGARANLRAEVPDFGFDRARVEARSAWNAVLSRMAVSPADERLARVFYTALYHACIHPSVFCDADGGWRGGDGAVHRGAGGHRRHTVFSLWDTYRAEHPLLTLVQPELVDDLVQSMLGFGREFGRLPVWELAGNETNTMIGYHSVPPIVEAIGKGLTGADPAAALDQMVHAATSDADRPGFQRTGLRFYAMPAPRPLAELEAEEAADLLPRIGDVGDAIPPQDQMLAGWTRSLAGATIGYHSADPTARRALIARARAGRNTVSWETAPAGESHRERPVTFVWLAAMDAGPGERRFTLSIDGRDALEFRQPGGQERRVRSSGARGELLEFRATHADRYGDLHGYAMLTLPAGAAQPGRPLRLALTADPAESDDWVMTFEQRLEPGISGAQRHLLAAEGGAQRQVVRLDIQHTSGAAPGLVRVAGGEVPVQLAFGLNRVLVTIPAVGRRTSLPVTLVVRGEEAAQGRVEVWPVSPYSYLPADEVDESVSRTLEYAYDDACIAALARRLGRRDVESRFARRAGFWRRLVDPGTLFMRGRRADGSWVAPFAPERGGHLQPEYTEGNAWQYSWYVPHDVPGLIAALGGREAFVRRLDELFEQPSVAGEGAPPDVTGLVGQYAHGNEPSHHIAYLYAWAGAHWRTEERVRHIVSTLYRTGPEGLCGNEDCGQLSAWLVLSATGLYPVDPASGVYVLGAPHFERVELALPEGRRCVVSAPGLSAERRWVRGAFLNGRPLERCWVRHRELAMGGELEFVMGDSPGRAWASRSPPPPSILDWTRR